MQAILDLIHLEGVSGQRLGRISEKRGVRLNIAGFLQIIPFPLSPTLLDADM